MATRFSNRVILSKEMQLVACYINPFVTQVWHIAVLQTQIALMEEVGHCHLQSTTPAIPYGQDQYILKAWHYADPIDNFEISRNDFVDSLQGNRNPFIDNPNYVCYIDFSNMSYIPNPTFPCNTVAVNEVENNSSEFMIAPNPSEGVFNLILNAKQHHNAVIKIYDQTGRAIYTKNAMMNSGVNSIPVDITELPSGVYVMDITSDHYRVSDKLIIH